MDRSLLSTIDTHVFNQIVEYLTPEFGGKLVFESRMHLLKSFTPGEKSDKTTRDWEVLQDASKLWPSAIQPEPKEVETCFKLWPEGQPHYLGNIKEVVLPTGSSDDAAAVVTQYLPHIDALTVGDAISTDAFRKLLSSLKDLAYMIAFSSKVKDVIDVLPESLEEFYLVCTNGEPALHVPVLAGIVKQLPKLEQVDVIVPPRPEEWLAEAKKLLAKEHDIHIEWHKSDSPAIFAMVAAPK